MRHMHRMCAPHPGIVHHAARHLGGAYRQSSTQSWSHCVASITKIGPSPVRRENSCTIIHALLLTSVAPATPDSAAVPVLRSPIRCYRPMLQPRLLQEC